MQEALARTLQPMGVRWQAAQAAHAQVRGKQPLRFVHPDDPGLYRTALTLGDNATVAANLAWLLATTSDDDLRNGKQALELARKADSLSGGQHPLVRHTLAAALAETAVTHKRTRPYRPQTNGKVERFHRILLEEWAYIRDWTSERERHLAYDGFMHFYNHHRSHGALAWATPHETLCRLAGDNLPAEHT